jgi:predicted phosphodiesterase
MKNKFIVISDIHFPNQDDKAIKCVFNFIKNHPVDTVIMNGDIVDFFDVSSFDKDPQRMFSLQTELDMTENFFKKLRKLLPEAEMYFVKGNHEDRMERYLQKHSELFTLNALKIPTLLQLEKFNIHYKPKGFKFGSLKIIHGDLVRKFSSYTARGELEKHDSSGISGHCFSEDVEVLTPTGWVPIIDVNIGDTVGTINKTTQVFEFNKVNDKFVYNNYKELYHIKSTVVDVMVTDKHGLLGFNQNNNKLEEFDAKYLATTNKRYKFMCGALKNESKGIDLSEAFIRLLVNISADGSIEDTGIRFHLKKERKITHLKALLNELGYEYSEVKTKFGTTRIRIKTRYAKPIINTYFSTGKHLPTILRDVNREQALIILDEYSLTDGNKNMDAKNSYQINSKKTTELDLLQEIFSKNGIRSSQLKRISHSILTVNTNPLTCITRDNVKIVPYKGRVSCVSVDNGTLIIRSKGKTLVTQNTHRGGVYYYKTPERYLAWYESFCLCDVHPFYVDEPNWQQGFLYGCIDKDSFAITPIPIVDGKIKCVLLED